MGYLPSRSALEHSRSWNSAGAKLPAVSPDREPQDRAFRGNELQSGQRSDPQFQQRAQSRAEASKKSHESDGQRVRHDLNAPMMSAAVHVARTLACKNRRAD
jgi:hypothetical protein